MTDLELKKTVETELDWEASVNAAEIGVRVKDGIVTLTGEIDSYWEKLAAERAAARVSGVKAVVNELEVRLPSSSERTDEDIAAAALNVLNWSVSEPADQIKVKVCSGWVTLQGNVDRQYQKEAAEEAVKGLYGVKGVRNLIEVTPRASKTELKAAIAPAPGAQR